MESGIADIQIITAKGDTDFAQGRKLFRQYIESLDFDLGFQDVDRELQEIHMEYNYPVGALLLAWDGKQGKAVGGIGVRRFDAKSAELKRMYILPGFRGIGLGVELLRSALEAAAGLGYSSVLLDSDSSMQKAIRLYRAFGFVEIPPYRFNPLKGAVYMKKELWAPA